MAGQQINRMMSIVLILLFVVVLGSFAFTMVGEAESSAVGKIQINSTQAMTQLIVYDTLIAHSCTDEKGGYRNYLDSWAEFREEYDFGLLEGAGSSLRCSASTSKLPLSQGFWDEVNPFDNDNWLNDQQGKYSRKNFVIEGDDPVELGPCIINEGNNKDMVFFVTDDKVANTLTWNKGYSFNNGNDYVSAWECNRIHGGSGNGGTSDGPVIVLNVIGADEANPNTRSVGAWNNFNDANTGGAHDIPLHFYELCKGTSGYIQTNVANNNDEVDDGADRGPHIWRKSGSYTAEQPPGDPDREVGGKSRSNRMHPYIVITNWESCD
ncbi:hypothetical protein ACK3SF_00525 [Candidatus Nanosalina sp. VS9-1]|uniref:hypothetical protein n=1 Tax=Candidatus Nanosalina sp. VS9-1 TaxID=3388566 RepID=UPI0039E025EA